MACEDPACADLLLAAGADLAHANLAGATALHVAVWECRDEMEAWLRAQYAARGVEPPVVGENPEGGDDDDGGGGGGGEDGEEIELGDEEEGDDGGDGMGGDGGGKDEA